MVQLVLLEHKVQLVLQEKMDQLVIQDYRALMVKRVILVQMVLEV